MAGNDHTGGNRLAFGTNPAPPFISSFNNARSNEMTSYVSLWEFVVLTGVLEIALELLLSLLISVSLEDPSYRLHQRNRQTIIHLSEIPEHHLDQDRRRSTLP
jgi:hypothetical protein